MASTDCFVSCDFKFRRIVNKAVGNLTNERAARSYREQQFRLVQAEFANGGGRPKFELILFLLRALLYSLPWPTLLENLIGCFQQARKGKQQYVLGSPIGRQIREFTQNGVIGGSGIQLRSLLEDNWTSFKLRCAQTFLLAIYVFKYK